MAVATLYNAGCSVTFTNYGVDVKHNGEIVLRRQRYPTNKPGKVPLNSEVVGNIIPGTPQDDLNASPSLTYHTTKISLELNHIYNSQNLGEFIQMYHQTLWSPTV